MSTQMELPTGKQLKDGALALLEATRTELVKAARIALVTAVLSKGTCTADDIRDAVPLPEGIDPVVFGAVPTPLVKAGIIRKGGYRNTARPGAHARPVTIWALVDKAKAEQWLNANR